MRPGRFRHVAHAPTETQAGRRTLTVHLPHPLSPQTASSQPSGPSLQRREMLLEIQSDQFLKNPFSETDKWPMEFYDFFFLKTHTHHTHMVVQCRGGYPLVLFNLQRCPQKAELLERPLPATGGSGCVRAPAPSLQRKSGPRTNRTRENPLSLVWTGKCEE